MSDERRESIREGMHPPEEGTSGRHAAEEKRGRPAEAPEIGGGMGGTSDADSPAEESLYKAQRAEADQRQREPRHARRREGERREGDRRQRARRGDSQVRSRDEP